jgi:hypothetical protein
MPDRWPQRRRISPPAAGVAWHDFDDDAKRVIASVVSDPRSRIEVVVEPTNEECVAASRALSFAGKAAAAARTALQRLPG